MAQKQQQSRCFSLADVSEELSGCLDKNNSTLQQTIVRVASSGWRKHDDSSFLSAKAEAKVLDVTEVLASRNECLRLLDSATAGGAIALQESETHVVFVCTQKYKQSIIDNVVKENTDVIDQLCKDWEIVASAMYK
jgi:hypothetical protein